MVFYLNSNFPNYVPVTTLRYSDQEITDSINMNKCQTRSGNPVQFFSDLKYRSHKKISTHSESDRTARKPALSTCFFDIIGINNELSTNSNSNLACC